MLEEDSKLPPSRSGEQETFSIVATCLNSRKADHSTLHIPTTANLMFHILNVHEWNKSTRTDRVRADTVHSCGFHSQGRSRVLQVCPQSATRTYERLRSKLDT